MKFGYFVLVCVIAVLSVSSTIGQNDQESFPSIHYLTYDDIERSYYLHVPESYNESEPAALIVALHPLATSGKAMAALTGLDDATERDGFIVVYPNTAGVYWDDGRSDYGVYPNDGGVDDVGFIGALIDTLAHEYNIDSERVYLTGIDNGGTMAYRLACETPERFARVAIVAAMMWSYHPLVCSESGEPVNLLIIHGTSDVPYPPGGREIGDSTTGFPLQALSIESTVTYWLSRNACDPESRVDTGNDAVLLFNGCADDTEVGIYLIFGNGHHWTRLSDEYTLNQFDIDTTETILRFFNDDDTWTQKQREPRPVGEARTYRYYLPSSYDPSTPTPVVVVLHGRPGNSSGIALITDMNPVAEREGFIVLYPEGITQGGGWNYLRPLILDPEEGVDDSAFMKTLIDDLSNDLNIDRSRVYVTGFSNGGFMTELLACEAQDTFAAFVTVGASAFPGLDRACAGQDAVPFMLIHGTADVSVPFAGLRQRMPSGDQVSVTFPIPDTVGFWAAHNGCDPTVETSALPQQGQSPDTEVFINTFSNCAERSTFVYYLVDGGGHNWPGVPGVIGEEIAGNVNMDINASDLAWEFFQQFTLDTE